MACCVGCAHAPVGESGDIVWSGEVRIAGVTEIPAGRRLVIRPGTRVIFDLRDDDGDGRGDAGILVAGSVMAEGGAAPIVFGPAAGGPRTGWGEIRLERGGPSVFAGCRFTGAQWALHSHLTPLRVESCTFDGNEGGVKFRGGPVLIADSLFLANDTAVRYWESGPLVRGNRFEGNGTAVFCREGSRGSVVRGNDFAGSADYHVKLGESQADDVDAGGNWWGTVVEEEIELRIFDREDAGYLGRVQHRPFETRPLPLAGAAGRGNP